MNSPAFFVFSAAFSRRLCRGFGGFDRIPGAFSGFGGGVLPLDGLLLLPAGVGIAGKLRVMVLCRFVQRTEVGAVCLGLGPVRAAVGLLLVGAVGVLGKAHGALRRLLPTPWALSTPTLSCSCSRISLWTADSAAALGASRRAWVSLEGGRFLSTSSKRKARCDRAGFRVNDALLFSLWFSWVSSPRTFPAFDRLYPLFGWPFFSSGAVRSSCVNSSRGRAFAHVTSPPFGGIRYAEKVQHLAAAQFVDTEIVLLGMCQRHALKAVRLLFQMNTEHTEHTAGALRAGGGQPAVFLHDLAVNGGIRDAGHFEICQNVLLCPEGHGLRGGVPLVIGVASDFEIDALAACALTGHGRNDLLSTGFPVISVQGPLLHDETALIGTKNGASSRIRHFMYRSLYFEGVPSRFKAVQVAERPCAAPFWHSGCAAPHPWKRRDSRIPI